MLYNLRTRPGSEHQRLKRTHLLPILLIDCIYCIFDCYTLKIPRRYFEPKGEVEVNLLDRWSSEHLLEITFLGILQCGRGLVDLPENSYVSRAQTYRTSLLWELDL